MRPLSLLEPSQYRVKIDSSVLDSAGNAIPVMTESLFTTSDQVDPSPPEIVSFTPMSNAAALNTTIVVSFDGPVNLLSVNESTFRVSHIGGLVAGTFSFSADQKTVTFTPNNVLNRFTSYTVNILNIRDLVGNRFLGLGRFTFGTGP